MREKAREVYWREKRDKQTERDRVKHRDRERQRDREKHRERQTERHTERDGLQSRKQGHSTRSTLVLINCACSIQPLIRYKLLPFLKPAWDWGSA